jgi:hypothetical protein
MKSMKLDKTVFKAQRFDEADKCNLFDKNTPLAERLKLAFQLTCSIYGIKDGDSLKIDRTVFSARKF